MLRAALPLLKALEYERREQYFAVWLAGGTIGEREEQRVRARAGVEFVTFLSNILRESEGARNRDDGSHQRGA